MLCVFCGCRLSLYVTLLRYEVILSCCAHWTRSYWWSRLLQPFCGLSVCPSVCLLHLCSEPNWSHWMECDAIWHGHLHGPNYRWFFLTMWYATTKVGDYRSRLSIGDPVPHKLEFKVLGSELSALQFANYVQLLKVATAYSNSEGPIHRYHHHRPAWLYLPAE